MNVLFLDFDGVLNSKKYLQATGGLGVSIDPSKMELLKKIISLTQARIVLSTSWREHWELESEHCGVIGEEINAIFKDYGLEIFDKTPKLKNRAEEIESWLAEHSEAKHFAVLDDMFLHSEKLAGHIVKTSDYFGGLNEEDVRKVIEILGLNDD